MSSIQLFGDLSFRTVSPDEIARATYFALLYGLQTESLIEAVAVRKVVRDVLPILATVQLSILLQAPWSTAVAGRKSDWEALRHEILLRATE